MWERRPMFGALIGLTLLLSLWSLAIQDSQIITDISSLPQQQQPNAPHIFSSITIVDQQQQLNQTQLPPVITELLGHSDFLQLINLDDFTFTINQKPCQELNAHPLVLILIHTAPKNIEKRNLIRETWGRQDPRSRLLFLLGASNTSQADIEYENEMYADIVQGNFIDAYKNMTYKHIMALKWFTYYCPQAKYILKTDDDVFINTPNVYTFLEKDMYRKNFLFCKGQLGARVKRSYRSKWRVSVKEYSDKYYPSYCPGFSIIYSPDVAFQLYREGQRSPYFWIDDVHVTGTLAKKINTNITPLGAVYWEKTLFNQNVPDDYIFTTPNLREDEIRRLWNLVLNDERSSSSTNKSV